MARNPLYAFVVGWLATSSFFCLSALAQTDSSSTRHAGVLDRIINQNRDAWDKIRTLQYDVEVDWVSPTDHRIYYGFGSVQRQGSFIRGEYTRSSYDRRENIILWNSSYCSINDKYNLTLPIATGSIAYLDEFDIAHPLKETIRSRSKFSLPFDSFIHSFGDEFQHFWDRNPLNDSTSNWDCVETTTGTGTVFDIRRFPTGRDNSVGPDKIWRIDPAQGYLPTLIESRKFSGKVWIRREIENRPAQNGIWVPVEYFEQHYGEGPATPDDQLATSLVHTFLTNYLANLDLPDNTFYLDALDLTHFDHPIRVIKTDVQGQKILLNKELTAEADFRRQPSSRSFPEGSRPADRSDLRTVMWLGLFISVFAVLVIILFSIFEYRRNLSSSSTKEIQ